MNGSRVHLKYREHPTRWIETPMFSNNNAWEGIATKEIVKIKRMLSVVVVFFSVLHLIHFSGSIQPQTPNSMISPLEVSAQPDLPSPDSQKVSSSSAPMDDTIIHSNNSSNNTGVAQPKLQLALTSSANGLIYAMRFWANSMDHGWHKDFENVPIYTFDEIADSSPLSNLFTQIQPLFKKEKTKKDNNLLLAAIEAVYNHNPNADWYLLAEDDTILVKENLLHAIDYYKLDPSKEFLGGMCAGIDSSDINGTELPVTFVVGGSGILMSHALVKAMQPYIPTCRKTMNKVMYGDQRIGACLLYEMNRGDKGQETPDLKDLGVCQINENYHMKNKAILSQLEYYGSKHRSKGDRRIISLHVKDVDRIHALNEWMSAREGKDITLNNMAADSKLVEVLKKGA